MELDPSFICQIPAEITHAKTIYVDYSPDAKLFTVGNDNGVVMISPDGLNWTKILSGDKTAPLPIPANANLYRISSNQTPG